MFELFTEVTRPDELRVIAWSCVEEICAGFRADVTVASAPGSAEDLAGRLLGQPVTLVLHGGGEPSVRRGVVASVNVLGTLERDRAEIALVLLPLVSLMKL